MNYAIYLGIKIGIAAILAVLFGNGCVVMFNRIPVRWFEDLDEQGNRVLPEALREQGDGSRQRLPSTPWKYLFVAFFGAVGVFLALREGVQYEMAVLCILAIVLLMAIADAKYRIVPDQLSILLAISAVGLIGYHEEWWEPVAGAGIGILLALSVWGLGRLLYHKDVIGGADLKFYAAMGLVTGRTGILIIFILTQLLMALHGVWLMIRKETASGEGRPMLPYAFVAVTVYLLFLWNYELAL
ncbi:MAG: prepilin peptidase [Mogibacterium sp.]|nr:prepilin peptidase [Mogibacterium sp.]